jgi:hypothetical protein
VVYAVNATVFGSVDDAGIKKQAFWMPLHCLHLPLDAVWHPLVVIVAHREPVATREAKSDVCGVSTRDGNFPPGVVAQWFLRVRAT